MSISKKILVEIGNLEESNEFKKLLIALLETEDKGNHKNNQTFENEIKDFLEKEGSN